MMIIFAAILIFAAIVSVLIQQKIVVSEMISKQQQLPAAAQANPGDSLEGMLNSGNNTSTNLLAPLPAPVLPATNSN